MGWVSVAICLGFTALFGFAAIDAAGERHYALAGGFALLSVLAVIAAVTGALA